MQVTPMNFERKDETIVANIMIDQTWKTTVGGEEFTFPPLAQFRVSVEEGVFLLEKAKADFDARAEQARSERNMWARKISSMNQREKDMALRFCDADGNPISKLFPCIPLVNLSTKAGREAYQAAYDKAKAAGRKPDYIATKVSGLDLNVGYIPDPDAGNITRGESRKFETEAYPEGTVVPPRGAPPATAQAQVEEEPEPDSQQVKAAVRIPRPSEKWSDADLEKFIKSKGFSVQNSDRKIEGRLLDTALRAHGDHMRRLTAAGVEFVEE